MPQLHVARNHELCTIVWWYKIKGSVLLSLRQYIAQRTMA